MRLFARLSDLITVNMHSLLDQAENPEQMLTHLLRDMEEGLASTRREAAKAIAAENHLRRQLEQCQSSAAHGHEQARLALTQGREDLARRALAHKIDYDTMVSSVNVQHAAACRLSMDVKAALHALRRRLDEARRRQSLLLARRRTAQIRLEAERWIGRCLSDQFTGIEQLERRLTDGEDELLAQIEVNRLDGELETELANLERDRRVEEELREMKRQ